MKNKPLYQRKMVLSLCLVFITTWVNAQSISWTKINGPYSGNIDLISGDHSGHIIASTSNGIFKDDQSAQWRSLGAVLEFPPSFLITDSNDNIYVGNKSEGLIISTDNGASWNKNTFNTSPYTAKLIYGDEIIVGLVNSVSISKDFGNSWTTYQITNKNVEILSIAEDDSGKIYAGLRAYYPRESPAYGGGIYISSDSGKTWKLRGMEFNSIYGITVDKSGLVVASIAGYDGIQFLASDLRIYSYKNIVGLFKDPANVIVAVRDSGLIAYDAISDNWKTVSPPISNAPISTACYDKAGRLYAGTERDGVFALDTSSSNWIQVGVYEDSIKSLAIGKEYEIYAGTRDGIYRMKSGSEVWERMSDGLGKDPVNSIRYANLIRKIYASTESGLFSLSEGGNRWKIESNAWVYDAAESSDSLGYACSTGGGILLRSKEGNWSKLQTVGMPNAKIFCITLDTSNILFVGAQHYGVLKSTNGGTFWTQTGISSPFIFNSVVTLSVDHRGRMFSGTDSAGAYYSDNQGDSWEQISSIPSEHITYFLTNNSKQYFVGTSDQGVYSSIDGGITWQSANDNNIDLSISFLASDSQGYTYAATSKGLFKNKSAVTNVIKDVENPISFSLSQNFPNPFNPETNIAYEVLSTGFVNLKVYDILGREVTTLVNERKNPGVYQVTFDGSRYSAGVYVYQMILNGSMFTKKMSLVK